MPAYTVDQLRKEGPPFAMAMLLRSLKAGEPFITYRLIAGELQYQLEIKQIFPIHSGPVVGTLMDKILKIDPNAPLINAMVTKPSGIPGKGVGNYFADRYGKEKYRDWDNLHQKEKIELIEKERINIKRYRKWDALNEKLFGSSKKIKLRELAGKEIDGISTNGKNYGGPAESDEHKKLKAWVADNPREIGINEYFGKGEIEALLLSGDIIDVLFKHDNDFIAVEVKSCRSNDEDFKRGLYQCVKYREVKMAENLPYEVNVRSILVTERELNPFLKERARLLKVKHEQVSVNKNW
ncbi:MAG: hypothetical protein JXI43_11365 [Tissierellales bacterium]|nr:hypothetical protein [Tissierellales bacterium]